MWCQAPSVAPMPAVWSASCPSSSITLTPLHAVCLIKLRQRPPAPSQHDSAQACACACQYYHAIVGLSCDHAQQILPGDAASILEAINRAAASGLVKGAIDAAKRLNQAGAGLRARARTSRCN